jgi:hypothetical protein
VTDLVIFDAVRIDLIRQHSSALHTIARYSDDAATIAALVDCIIVARLLAEFQNFPKETHHE